MTSDRVSGATPAGGHRPAVPASAPASAQAPLADLADLPVSWRERVRAEWCDYNNHLNLAYYVLIFDHATDVFHSSLGLGEAYRRETGHSTFAVEAHVNYIAELRDGDEAACTTQLLDCDAKRLHYFHRMYHAGKGHLVATTEIMVVHVDLGARRVAPMPPAIAAAAQAVLAAHAALPRPEQQGRVIGIRRQAGG
ncbi:MAG: thioesterase family protein [Rhodospirillaceae bacterium]